MLTDYAYFEKYRVTNFSIDHRLHAAKFCPYPEDMLRKFGLYRTYRWFFTIFWSLECDMYGCAFFVERVKNQKSIPNICLQFCVDLIKNVFFTASLALTYILAKVPQWLNCLYLLSSIIFKKFICIGLKIISHKVLWNFIKTSRMSCEKTDLAKIQNGRNLSMCKGTWLILTDLPGSTNSRKKKNFVADT